MSYKWILAKFIPRPKSSIKIENKRGAKTDPCGTPLSTLRKGELHNK